MTKSDDVFSPDLLSLASRDECQVGSPPWVEQGRFLALHVRGGRGKGAGQSEGKRGEEIKEGRKREVRG